MSVVADGTLNAIRDDLRHPGAAEVTMTSRRGSPTLRRRQLGMELRRLREAAGVTIDQVAERLECSASKISRIETGQSGATTRDVRDILEVYRVSSDEADTLLQIAREARQKGWWQLFGTVLTGAYVGLEAAADAVRSYEALVVPGLLQTEDYARAMIRAARPDIDMAEVDQLVASADQPNITLQVLPFAAGAHAGMDGTFTMLLYEEPTNQNVVFAANAAGGLFLEKDEELTRYSFIFDHLRANALRPEESAAMIAALAKEL